MNNDPNIPSFSVIDDVFQHPNLSQDNNNNNEEIWKDMYSSNLIPTNKERPKINDNYIYSELNDPNTHINHHTLDHPYQKPYLPKSYNNNLENNYLAQANLADYNLQTSAPAPLPSKMPMPNFVPQYGTPYPTNGYSAFDGTMANDARVNAFYGLGGVPISTPPSLQDARNSYSIPLGYSGYREGYHNDHSNCSNSINHMNNCEICKSYINMNCNYYKFIIAVLIVLIIILLCFLMSRNLK
jgi:hypothetical protein